MFKFTSIASGSTGNLYTVEVGKDKLILESGINFRALLKALGYSLKAYSGCLLTHEHQDHSKSISDLIKQGMTVYSSPGTFQALNLSGYFCKCLEPLQEVQIGNFTVLPFPVRHDAKQPYGYLIYHAKSNSKLLFATDTFYIKYKFKGLTHIAIECNYDKQILNEQYEKGKVNESLRLRLLKSHMSLDTVKEFLCSNDLSNVQQIHLLHLSDKRSNEKKFKKEIQTLTGIPVYIAKQ